MLLSKKFQPKSKVLRNLLLLLIIIGSTINIIVISFEDVFLEISKSNNVVRRLYSLYNPKVDEMGFANREDRMLAVSYAYDLATVNYGLGYGYGDNTFVKLDDEETRRIITGNEIADNPGNLIEGLLLFHNSYAWSLARLGLWLSIIFFIAILKLILRAHKVIYENENQFDRLVLSGSVAFAIYTLVSGFGGGGFFDYMGTGMVPWLFCLAILTSCSEQNQKKFLTRNNFKKLSIIKTI